MDYEQFPLLQDGIWWLEELCQTQLVTEQELPSHSEGQEPGGGHTLASLRSQWRVLRLYNNRPRVLKLLHGVMLQRCLKVVI